MKPFWHSKTFWVNILAIAALVVQNYTGKPISAESQVAILGVVNVFLRFITKDEVTWGG